MRIATFNVQNLRLREDAAGIHFDGARDEVLALSKLSAADRALDAQDRALTAQLIAAAKPDLLALQEVFDLRTLDTFHDTWLAPIGVSLPFRVCVPGNDGRRRVALMSRYPLENVRSHSELTYADIGLAADGYSTCAGIFFMVVHFKAPVDEQSLSVVRAEAIAVRRLIDRQFEQPLQAPWIVVGDFNVNDVSDDDVLASLTGALARDLGAHQAPSERWTYFHPHRNSYARPDRFLVSPAIASRSSPLVIHRSGMSRAASVDNAPRLDGVGEIRPRASDHALLTFDVEI
jgi:endonuclease/exonuclease/phosphatase family metal-dependent hydrolase